MFDFPRPIFQCEEVSPDNRTYSRTDIYILNFKTYPETIRAGLESDIECFNQGPGAGEDLRPPLDREQGLEGRQGGTPRAGPRAGSRSSSFALSATAFI